MAIAADYTNVDLPIMGAPFYHTEDLFYSNSPLNSPETGQDAVSSPQEICISCKRKRRRVFGYLSEPITMEGSADWKPAFNSGSITAGGIMAKAAETLSHAADNGFMLNFGTSFQQPWMQRMNWASSKPFTLNFAFNLISDTDGGVDVMSPAIALMSFLYPRLIKENEVISGGENQSVGQATFAQIKQKLSKGWQVGPITLGGPNTLIGTAADSLNMWHIPGPSIRYGAKDNSGVVDDGDPVAITIGDMFAFGGCYLKTVKLEFSPNTDINGLPTWCKCTMSAQAMDSNYCQPDGTFLLSGFGDSAAAIGAYLDAAKKVTENVVKDTIKIAQTTYKGLTFWGNSPKKEA